MPYALYVLRFLRQIYIRAFYVCLICMPYMYCAALDRYTYMPYSCCPTHGTSSDTHGTSSDTHGTSSDIHTCHTRVAPHICLKKIYLPIPACLTRIATSLRSRSPPTSSIPTPTRRWCVCVLKCVRALVGMRVETAPKQKRLHMFACGLAPYMYAVPCLYPYMYAML